MLLLSDYQAIATLRHIAFVEQTTPAVLLWTRHADGWRAEDVSGLEASLALEAVGVQLPLADIYEGLTFEAATSNG